jgi:hypothetical protein
VLPWTALLQSLHSALIDELVEKVPEPKPTLGMPIRFSSWKLPEADPSITLYLEYCAFKEGLPGSTKKDGFAVIALTELASKRLSANPEIFWKAVFKRTGSEFTHRNIRPIWSGGISYSAKDLVSSDLQTLTRLIWTPIELSPGERVFFGVGILA